MVFTQKIEDLLGFGGCGDLRKTIPRQTRYHVKFPAGQLLAALPRVLSSEAFGRRTLHQVDRFVRPASETLTDTGHSGETGLIPHSPDLPRFFDAELLRSFERC